MRFTNVLKKSVVFILQLIAVICIILVLTVDDISSGWLICFSILSGTTALSMLGVWAIKHTDVIKAHFIAAYTLCLLKLYRWFPSKFSYLNSLYRFRLKYRSIPRFYSILVRNIIRELKA